MKKGLPLAHSTALVEIRKEALMEQYVGLDWAYRRARWVRQGARRRGARRGLDAQPRRTALLGWLARLRPDMTAGVGIGAVRHGCATGSRRAAGR